MSRKYIKRHFTDIIAKTQMIIYRHKLFYTKYIGLKHVILLKFNKLKID